MAWCIDGILKCWLSYSLYKISALHGIHYPALSLSLFLHILSSLLPLSMTMAGNHLIVHIFEPEVALHIMATTPTEFADTVIWFCLSG